MNLLNTIVGALLLTVLSSTSVLAESSWDYDPIKVEYEFREHAGNTYLMDATVRTGEYNYGNDITEIALTYNPGVCPLYTDTYFNIELYDTPTPTVNDFPYRFSGSKKTFFKEPTEILFTDTVIVSTGGLLNIEATAACTDQPN